MNESSLVCILGGSGDSDGDGDGDMDDPVPIIGRMTVGG